MRKFLASVAIFFALAGTAQARDFQKGLAAFESANYTTALKELRPLAEQEDETTKFNLALMYFKWWGVSQDTKVAVSWYRKSAEQRASIAPIGLGVLYRDGLPPTSSQNRSSDGPEASHDFQSIWTNQIRLTSNVGAAEGVVQMVSKSILGRS